MKNRWLHRMKVINSLCNIKGYFVSEFPIDFDLFIVKNSPERSSSTVLKNYTKIWWLCACSKKHNNVRMSNHFHHCTFIFELVKLFLLNNLELDLLNGNLCLFPSSFVNYSVSSFTYLFVKFQIFILNFKVC